VFLEDVLRPGVRSNVLPDLFTTIASWTVELAEGLDSSELAVSLLGALISPDNGAAREFLELRDKLDVLLLESDAAHARQLTMRMTHLLSSYS